VIVSRPGLNPPGDGDLQAAGIDPRRTTLCPVTTPDVAATRIRNLAGEGSSLTGLVPAAVETYIRANGLYRTP
jgi:nicotinic acid mononucleotide adenylyltransferase